ncbi:MAG: asparagine--tRNA ligase, partial [Clostridiales bacterium]|nr:asparagine--tRNA ligase [Clostridiales bacterium]
MYTKIKDVFLDSKSFTGKEVSFGGWVKTIRDNKNFGFIELNDGTYFKSVQVVFDNALNNFD